MRCLRDSNRGREREHEIEKMNKGEAVGLGTRDDSGSRGVAAVGGTEG